jgi:flagellar hook-associated protein 1
MSITSILHMARDSLLNTQLAISIASNNIANVDTEGYSRQQAVFSSRGSIAGYYGLVGQGADISSIQRQHDQFIQNQLNDENSISSRWELSNSILEEIELTLSSDETYGISKDLNDFWGAWGDLSSEPLGYTERSSLVSTAVRLTQSFNSAATGLEKIQEDLDTGIQSTVNEINTTTKAIADLNQKIASVQAGREMAANDLLDQRDQLLNNLAELVDFDVVTDQAGNANVYLKNGTPLVSDVHAWELKTDTFKDESQFHDVTWDDGNGGRRSVLSAIGGGKLSAMIEQRDDFIPKTLDQIDLLAASITQEVNRIHVQGTAADGTSGNNFFEPLQGRAWADNSNAGDAAAEAGVFDEGALTLHEYEVVFSDANNFTVRDKVTGLDVATHDLSSDGPAVFFDGIELTFPGGGTAQAGDTFTVSTTSLSAKNMSVSSEVLANHDKIATSLSSDPGKNQGALDIAALQTARTMRNGTVTFEEALAKVVGDVGVARTDAKTNGTFHGDLLNYLNTMREQVSGVSLDEEMVELMKFQRSFQASAKLISIVDQMYETIVDSIKR